jgi:hypothetical protein
MSIKVLVQSLVSVLCGVFFVSQAALGFKIYNKNTNSGDNYTLIAFTAHDKAPGPVLDWSSQILPGDEATCPSSGDKNCWDGVYLIVQSFNYGLGDTRYVSEKLNKQSDAEFILNCTTTVSRVLGIPEVHCPKTSKNVMPGVLSTP